MNITKSEWQLIFFALVVITIIGLNELGYGVISLFLLFPAVWLMQKAAKNEKYE